MEICFWIFIISYISVISGKVRIRFWHYRAKIFNILLPLFTLSTGGKNRMHRPAGNPIPHARANRGESIPHRCSHGRPRLLHRGPLSPIRQPISTTVRTITRVARTPPGLPINEMTVTSAGLHNMNVCRCYLYGLTGNNYTRKRS